MAGKINNPSVLPSASHRLGGARETPPRSGNAPNNGAFPSSQVVKATPWLCQERTCSPLKKAPEMRNLAKFRKHLFALKKAPEMRSLR